MNSRSSGVQEAVVVEHTLSVACVPSSHVYARHTLPLSGGRVSHLPDPDPDDTRRTAGARWWPPAMLDPGWIASHRFDVFHLQFGFDARRPDELAAMADALRETGRPLVYTVHDLRNPHHLDRSLHDAQLDELIPAADALVTLTPGAAREIDRRWGREAVVLPHPHVVDLDTMRRHAAAHGPRAAEFRVGVHLKSLRASMDPLPVLAVLRGVLAELPDSVLQVNVHRDVLDHDSDNHDPEVARYLRILQGADRVEVHEHDFLSDHDLWRYLGDLDVSVLPYRFGTHSGWLEACRDLGTTVIAPTCGYFDEQGPVLSYQRDEAVFDEDSLVQAVRRAHRERPDFGISATERLRQRSELAAAHHRIYQDLTQHLIQG